MTANLLNLEDFSQPPNIVTPAVPAADTKNIQKQAFDEGYRDGWNDAFKEARTEEGTNQANIATALQELGFTYFEARQHIMGSFKPLLEAMLKSVLPSASSASLTALVQEELVNLGKLVEPPVKILCAPQNYDQLSALVKETASVPILVEAEQTLTVSQVKLVYPDGFTALNADAAIKRIEETISTFFDPALTEDLDYA